VRLQQEIVERKRAEQELLKASKIESLGIFAGGIAHDFNNLLTAIMGNISLARANTDPGNPNYTILAEAESASMKTKDLTHQLLTFSKGGAPIKQATSVESLLRDTADFVLRGSTIRCRYRIPEDLWNAEVDAGQFSQVVHNIVINARQAMPGGGELSIEARNVPAGEIRLLPLPAGNYIAITIADTGGGIPEEHLHKIFDPYFTTKEHGNGLGLAITYSIIRNHGGYITAESLPGGGAAFTIYLPSSDRPASPSDKAAEEEFTGRGRILVMDDEEFVLKVASKMIEKLGFIPVPASNGDEAIELCRSAQREGNPFDAVIMDLTVPGGMGGKETMSRLKEIFPGIKAIVSSGYSEDPIMANYESYGFSGVLVKPYRFEELAAALRRLLG
jgi:nitrogen-specific signal transduction histidine kinase/ActR/RegA family two-component response regulator